MGVQDRPEDWRCLRDGLKQTAMDMWPLWAAVAQPVLVLRGAESDLLSAVTVEKCWPRITAPGVSPRR